MSQVMGLLINLYGIFLLCESIFTDVTIAERGHRTFSVAVLIMLIHAYKLFQISKRESDDVPR